MIRSSARGRDDVYIDASSTLDSNAVLLGSFTHTGLLDPGDSYSQSQLVTLPIDLLGSYNLFIVADASGGVPESDITNNDSAPVPISIELSLSPSGGTGSGGTGGTGTGGGGQGGGGTGGGVTGSVPHAQVSDLEPTSVTGPGMAVTAGSLTLDWTVENNGPGATDSSYWYDDLWMSTHTTLKSGGTDVLLGAVQHTNALAPGDSYSASGTFTVPRGTAPGNYYFIVVTNASGLVYETDTANDELASTTAAAVSPGPIPELAVSNVTVSSNATSGGQLEVGWTVQNIGGETGDVPITDSVYLSYDQYFDPSDRYLGSLNEQGGLDAGASYTQNRTFSLPAGLAGTFYVFVQTNSNGAVYEPDTANNAAFDPQPVQISLPPEADLVAGTITIPANAVAGQDITISYQVTNDGGNPANGSWVRLAIPLADGELERRRPALGQCEPDAGCRARRKLYRHLDGAGARRHAGLVLRHPPHQHPGRPAGSDALEQLECVTHSNRGRRHGADFGHARERHAGKWSGCVL